MILVDRNCTLGGLVSFMGIFTLLVVVIDGKCDGKLPVGFIGFLNLISFLTGPVTQDVRSFISREADCWYSTTREESGYLGLMELPLNVKVEKLSILVNVKYVTYKLNSWLNAD